MNTLTAMHIADNYLLNPTNPVTINLIGAGGTGSHMLTKLAEMNCALIALGHAGLQVNLFDDDRVTEANTGKQVFAESEIGLYKSVVLINRANRFCGTNWKAVTQKFDGDNRYKMPEGGKANIYVSCVDTVASRFGIAKFFEQMPQNSYGRNTPLYWMDMGNSRYSGQVILATLKEIKQPVSKLYRTVSVLPKITDEFRDLLLAETDNSEPSCSHAEALEKQELFINPTVANYGAQLLWLLFRKGMTDTRGVFINLENFKTEPLKVA